MVFLSWLEAPTLLAKIRLKLSCGQHGAGVPAGDLHSCWGPCPNLLRDLGPGASPLWPRHSSLTVMT